MHSPKKKVIMTIWKIVVRVKFSFQGVCHLAESQNWVIRFRLGLFINFKSFFFFFRELHLVYLSSSIHIGYNRENKRLFGLGLTHYSKFITQNSYLKLITHISKLYFTNNPKLKILCLVHNWDFVPLHFFPFLMEPTPCQILRTVTYVSSQPI